MCRLNLWYVLFNGRLSLQNEIIVILVLFGSYQKKENCERTWSGGPLGGLQGDERREERGL